MNLNLEEIRAREQAATPRPWEVTGCCNHLVAQNNGDDTDKTTILAEIWGYEGRHKHDAEFIAHAREDIPALLDEIARLTAKCEALERALGGYCWACKMANKAFPGLANSKAVGCELLTERNILGVNGKAGRDCEHWQFNEARFAKVAASADSEYDGKGKTIYKHTK